MSEYNNLITSLRKKAGPLVLEEILRLQELQTLPEDALGPGSVEREVSGKLSEIVSVVDFGAASSALSVWAAAFAALAASSAKIKTLRVPRAIYTFSIAAAADRLASALAVPSGVFIDCEPGTVLQFDDINLPLLSFISCNRGGIRGANFVFTGSTPSGNAYSKSDYATRMGVPQFFGGTSADLSAVIFTQESEYLLFEDLSFESAAPSDNTKRIPICIHLRYKEGTDTQTVRNTVRNIRFYDYQHGLLTAGQDGLTIRNLSGDRRGGTSSYTGPGHLWYNSGKTTVPTKNFSASWLHDGKNTISYASNKSYQLGTLAIKNALDGTISNVFSEHPEGIIESIQNVQNVDFSNVSWLTTDSDDQPAASAISIIGSDTIDRLMFRNFSLIAPNKMVAFGITATGTLSNILVDGYHVECQMNFYSGQGSASRCFGIPAAMSGFVGRSITVKPSAPTSGGNNYLADVAAGATGCYLEARVIGPNAIAKFGRVTASGSTGLNNRFNVSIENDTNEDYLWTDAATIVANARATVVARPQHCLMQVPAETSGVGGDGNSGANTCTISLPKRGSYLVSIDVVSANRSHGQSGLFWVIWTGQTATLNSATQIGSTVTRGTAISSLAVTVSTTGVMSIGFTKGSAFFCVLNIGWVKLGSFVT